MVKVRDDHFIKNGVLDTDSLLQSISDQVEIKDPEQVRQACALAQSIENDAINNHAQWTTDMSSLYIGIEMTQVLSELHMDQPSVVAAIIYRPVREGRLSLERVEKQFGEEIAKLIDGVLKMAAITQAQSASRLKVLGQSEAQVEHIRKMLVAMIDDVRVALIKLAERTSIIRAVKNASPERRLKVAREVFDVYAPLAHRLGIGHIKWELEDLSFRYLEPEAYKKIAKLLDEKRLDRQEYVANVVETLKNAIEASGIECDVQGRAKHIYSIWRKMSRKNIDFGQVYDIRAVRILVPEVKDCYAALGITHTFWKHIPHEFDDYIANPKENGYRSLHTAVIGPEGKVLEVQIRTFDMHDDAELGVCAHWLYKGTDVTSKDNGYEEKISWLRQVLEWHDELGDLSELMGNLRQDVTPDRIYVFTPEGHVVDLPPESTPIDFAYRVHTEIGHRCRGGKINGRIVPLTYKLKTGDQVEILTSRDAHPSRDWLNPENGYVNTSRARAKVASWFKSQARDQNVIDGKGILLPELKRIGFHNLDMLQIAKDCNFHSLEDLYAAVGAGTVRVSQVLNHAQKQIEPQSQTDKAQLSLLPNLPIHHQVEGRGDIYIHGVGKLLTTIAPCCHPVPGDPIVGYVTQGRGISIHRADCINLLNLKRNQSNRITEVSWGIQPENVYPVELILEAYDRRGLVKDVSITLANDDVNILSLNTHSKDDGTADLLLAVEIDSLQRLGKILNKLQQLPNVIDVRRHQQ
ncbi:GTP diphosphokinase [Bermanella sp. R86510]|uniref:GTP diphosphokinase n=1 Tax=unclassified Bermanella TaxID=2627862 RepID=UPI0037C9726A